MSGDQALHNQANNRVSSGAPIRHTFEEVPVLHAFRHHCLQGDEPSSPYSFVANRHVLHKVFRNFLVMNLNVITSATYKCSHKSCQRTFSVSDENAVVESGLIPSEIYALSRVKLFEKTGFHCDLLDLIFDLMSTRCSANNIVRCIATSRTSYYIRMASLYSSHVRQFASHPFHAPQSYKEFPGFYSHCQGFNATLGPSSQTIATLFVSMCDQQREFWIRTISGVTGRSVCSDHHFQCATRLKHQDTNTKLVSTPCSSIFCWMSDKLQIGAAVLCNGTSIDERIPIGREMSRRFRSRGLPNPVVWTDLCCGDSSWLRSEMPSIKILLDNMHLINR